MAKTWEEHQKLLTELDRQRIEREAREARETPGSGRSPLRASPRTRQSPVDLSRYRQRAQLDAVSVLFHRESEGGKASATFRRTANAGWRLRPITITGWRRFGISISCGSR